MGDRDPHNGGLRYLGDRARIPETGARVQLDMIPASGLVLPSSLVILNCLLAVP